MTDMTGKTCLVTGGNGGIGFETAKALVGMGADIIIVARDEKRGSEAKGRLAAIGSGNVDLIIADLSLVYEVKQAAKEVTQNHEKLDVLVNNAGAAYGQRIVTDEGLEFTFALNFLAPFVLTQQLIKPLKESKSGRIVNVSSSAHKAGKIDFENLMHERGYSRMKAYANTKLALTLFTFELAKRLEGTGVTCNAVNPGFVNTKPSYATKVDLLIGALMSPFGKSPENGAIPSVFAATAPELESATGAYIDPRCRMKEAVKESYDSELATKLWDEAERIIAMCEPV